MVLASGEAFPVWLSPLFGITFLLGHACYGSQLATQAPPAVGPLLPVPLVTVTFSGSTASSALAWALVLLVAVAAPGSQVVATFRDPHSHVGSPPYPLGASRVSVRGRRRGSSFLSTSHCPSWHLLHLHNSPS